MPRLQTPTELRAIALSSTQVKLTWKDNSSKEVGFIIERLNNGIWQQIVQVGKNVTTYTDSNLSPNTTYQYRLMAKA